MTRRAVAASAFLVVAEFFLSAGRIGGNLSIASAAASTRSASSSALRQSRPFNGLTLSSSVVLGPWFIELYPAHLKSLAASIFNWARIVSFFAPLATGSLAGVIGLGATMGLASVIFVIAALLWLMLPKTHPNPLWSSHD